MGRNEFYAWVEQLNRESEAVSTTNSWAAADNDAGWDRMREKRRKARGR